MEENIMVINPKDLGAKMNTSRSAEIYEYGDGKILKLYFPSYPDSDIQTEYINTKEAFDKGATPMKIYGMAKCNGRLGIILERIMGETQIERFLKHFSYLFKAGKDLAYLHLMVHKKTTEKMPDYLETVIHLLDDPVFDFLDNTEKQNLIKYIHTLKDDNKIIHLDFHVNNVLMTKDDKFVVIDWMTACKGSPLAELSMMHFLLTQAELFPGISKIQALVFSICKKILNDKFMKTYLKETGLKKKDYEPYRITTLIFRYGTWKIESEKPRIVKEIKQFAISLGEK